MEKGRSKQNVGVTHVVEAAMKFGREYTPERVDEPLREAAVSAR